MERRQPLDRVYQRKIIIGPDQDGKEKRKKKNAAAKTPKLEYNPFPQNKISIRVLKICLKTALRAK